MNKLLSVVIVGLFTANAYALDAAPAADAAKTEVKAEVKHTAAPAKKAKEVKKAAEAKAADVRPADVKPAEAKPADAKAK